MEDCLKIQQCNFHAFVLGTMNLTDVFSSRYKCIFPYYSNFRIIIKIYIKTKNRVNLHEKFDLKYMRLFLSPMRLENSLLILCILHLRTK